MSKKMNYEKKLEKIGLMISELYNEVEELKEELEENGDGVNFENFEGWWDSRFYGLSVMDRNLEIIRKGVNSE